MTTGTTAQSDRQRLISALETGDRLDWQVLLEMLRDVFAEDRHHNDQPDGFYSIARPRMPS